MTILRTALAVACALALLGPPALAGCPCAKSGAEKERGALSSVPTNPPLPPPLPPIKTMIAAAGG